MKQKKSKVKLSDLLLYALIIGLIIAYFRYTPDPNYYGDGLEHNLMTK